MNKLFIPELGTKLKLAQDWHFTIINEYRNEKAIHHVTDYISLPKIIRYLNMRFIHKNDQYNPKYIEYLNEYNNYMSYNSMSANYNIIKKKEQELINELGDKYFDFNTKELPAFLPTGTELTVDRIYIRKGKSDYSSISFYALMPGQKKKFRFFAKLEDCNNIYFL